jgi:chromosome partitioning protein
VTNLAGYFAMRGERVLLTDLDRQQSSSQWLARRPAEVPLIHSNIKQALKPDWIITDSPAGLRDDKLTEVVKAADCVIVPIQPSAFNIGATNDFLDVLAKEKAIRKERTFVAMVVPGGDARARSLNTLNAFL